MHYRKLGRFGVRVSEVAVGGWLTHGRSIQDETTGQIVRRALELGINFFDTADVYNAGEAEKSLAKALEGVRRDDVFIATKCYFPMSDKPNDRGLSKKHIFESVHNSLRRLKTDYVDLHQFHRFDPEVLLDESVRAIDELIKQGKVLYWGVSEWPAHEISRVAAVARAMNANPPVSNQPSYSMLNRRVEDGVLDATRAEGMGNVVFSPLAQGVLSGKYLPGQPPPAGTRGADDKSNMFMGGVLRDEVLTRVQELKALAENELGVSVAAFALAWCLRRPEVSSVIIGATKPEQVDANAQASGLAFGDDVWAKADSILGFAKSNA